MSLSPFIFIGVGGTGGKTLGVIRQTLADTLDRIGWHEDWPLGWQFLHIDVPADPDARSSNLPYTLSRSQYVALTDHKSSYANYADGIGTTIARTAPDPAQRYEAWDCWQPYPASSVKVNIINGAGQYRAIGRVCVLQQLSRVDRALAAAFDAATNATSAGQLHRIQESMGDGNTDVTDGRPTIFVVGSAAGGSGSGMLLDVCEVLRARGHKEINALIFTPEVFEYPDGTTDPGVAPNTFMALNEITNSMWTTDAADAPLSRDLMFQRAGVGHPVGHGGPSTVFLVGRRNGSVTFATADDVYKIVGRSLAELALNESLTRDVIAYDLANSLAVAAGGTDNLRLSSSRRDARDLAVFRSLGFARLSVGRDFFDKYAVDRISRAVTLRLLDGHLLRRQPGSHLSDDELLNEAVEEAWDTLLDASELDEYGEEQNDITNRLRTLESPEVEAALRQLKESCHAALSKTAVRGKVKTLDAGRAIEQEVLLARDAVLEISLRVVGAKALSFRAEIQQTLGRVIAESMADDGLPVTAALVSRLIARSQKTLDSLSDDVAAYTTSEQEALRGLAVGKAVSAAEFPLTATDQVEALLKQARRAMGRAIQAQYHQAARGLLDDLVEHLLRPWHRAIVDADGLLRGEARPANQDSILDVWPTGDVPGEPRNIPDYLRPSKVEFLLDDVNAFPDDFQRVVDQSVSGVKGGAAIQRAIREVAAGANLGKAAELAHTPPVVDYEMEWSPEWDLARPQKQTKASAQIRLRLSLAHIRRRAHEWLWDDEKVTGHYLRTTLNDHLTDPLASETERRDRTSRLLEQFQAMVKASLPLVAIDPDMAQKIHGHAQPPFNLHTTPLNVPRELTGRLEDIAQALLNAPQNITTTTNPRSDAMMMTLLHEPYHMLEIASVMEPVTNQWSQLSATRDFWLWRRARPLGEWVPLSPLARADLVRGWFMARLQGVAYRGPDNKSLFVDFDKKTHQVGRYGVRPAVSTDDVGMLVEGFATATLDAYRSRSLEPLEPYRQLIALGGAFEDDHNPLFQWVDSGGLTAAREYSLLHADLDTAEGREAGALTLVAAWLESYRRDIDALSEIHQAQRHSTYELNADIIQALEEIRTGLGKVRAGIGMR